MLARRSTSDLSIPVHASASTFAPTSPLPYGSSAFGATTPVRLKMRLPRAQVEKLMGAGDSTASSPSTSPAPDPFATSTPASSAPLSVATSTSSSPTPPQIAEIDTWLSRVDQSPPESMYNTLHPTMSVLIKKELLDHTDPDVKFVVISCLTEVTRITAPEAPYDDDVMRDVFRRVVEAFGKLDNMNSPSFARGVSILENIAKVQSCVLMLDLDCDDLIQDTFHHFFRTISPTHQE